jgi:hypothetical protein
VMGESFTQPNLFKREYRDEMASNQTISEEEKAMRTSSRVGDRVNWLMSWEVIVVANTNLASGSCSEYFAFSLFVLEESHHSPYTHLNPPIGSLT